MPVWTLQQSTEFDFFSCCRIFASHFAARPPALSLINYAVIANNLNASRLRRLKRHLCKEGEGEREVSG